MVLQPLKINMLMTSKHCSMWTRRLLGNAVMDSNNDVEQQRTTVVTLLYLFAQLLNPAADFLLLLDLYLYLLHLPDGLHHLLLNLHPKAIVCSLSVQYNIRFSSLQLSACCQQQADSSFKSTQLIWLQQMQMHNIWGELEPPLMLAQTH